MAFTKPAADVFAGATSAGEPRDWISTDIAIWAEETELAAQTAAIGFEGGVHSTLASLNVVTPTQFSAGGLVVNDGGNNGVYRWNGSSWVQLLASLPGIPGPKGDPGDPANEAFIDGRIAAAQTSPAEAGTIGSGDAGYISADLFDTAFVARRATSAEVTDGTISNKYVSPQQLSGTISARFADFTEATGGVSETALMNPRGVRQAIEGSEASQSEAQSYTLTGTGLITSRRWRNAFSLRRATTEITDEGTSIDHYITPLNLKRVRDIDAAANATARSTTEATLQERDWQIAGGRLSPGEMPDAFTSALTGGADGAAVNGTAVDGARIKVLRLVGSQVVATRAQYSVSGGQLYVVRFALNRSVNPSDPTGDAIAVRVAWIAADNTVLLSGIVADYPDLRTTDGLQTEAAVIGPNATAIATGNNVGLEVPAGAVAFVPYIQTFGPDASTDIETIEIIPVATEAANLSITENITQTVTVPVDNLANVGAVQNGGDTLITADIPATPGFAIDEGRSVRFQIPAGGEGGGGAYQLRLGPSGALIDVLSSDGGALAASTFRAGELIRLTYIGTSWRVGSGRLYVDWANLRANSRTSVTEFGVEVNSESAAAANSIANQAALDANAPLLVPGFVTVDQSQWHGDQPNIAGYGKNVSGYRAADGASIDILLGDKRHRDNVAFHVRGGIIQDIWLDGNRSGGATCNALLTARQWMNQIRNVRLDASSGIGIWIPANTADGATAAAGATQGSIWSGLDIRDCGSYGIWAENDVSNDVFVVGSPTINGNGSLGTPQIRIASSGGWKFSGMHLFGTAPNYDGASAILLDGGRNTLFENCNFDLDVVAGAPDGVYSIIELGGFTLSQIIFSGCVFRHEGADEAGKTYHYLIVRGTTDRKQIIISGCAFQGGNTFQGFSNATVEVINDQGGTLDGIIDNVTFQGVTEAQYGALTTFPQCQTRHNSVGGHGVPGQDRPAVNSLGGVLPGTLPEAAFNDRTHPVNTTEKVAGTTYRHPTDGRWIECLDPVSDTSLWTYRDDGTTAFTPV